MIFKPKKKKNMKTPIKSRRKKKRRKKMETKKLTHDERSSLPYNGDRSCIQLWSIIAFVYG